MRGDSPSAKAITVARTPRPAKTHISGMIPMVLMATMKEDPGDLTDEEDAPWEADSAAGS